MKESQISLTAIMTAYIRAHHALNDDPIIFNDYLAYCLIPEERQRLIKQGFARALQSYGPERTMSQSDKENALKSLMQDFGLTNIVSRARYAEDNLERAITQGVQQYVILGAGMDTFAFRRADLLEQLQVFEVDHPATQSFKRNRLADLDWNIPINLHFVPVDLTNESLSVALNKSSYDPQTKSFFSWLGVTMYLNQGEVFSILRSITDVATSGSIVIFDYFVPEKATLPMQEMQETLQQIGEPMKTVFDPFRLSADLACLGLRLHEDMSPSDIQGCYFQERTDGYYACKNVHLALAIVE